VPKAGSFENLHTAEPLATILFAEWSKLPLNTQKLYSLLTICWSG
jgi:hypothetical protein